jgi:hypothetical protein
MKLEATKAWIPVLVVDHVEKPFRELADRRNNVGSTAPDLKEPSRSNNHRLW